MHVARRTDAVLPPGHAGLGFQLSVDITVVFASSVSV